MSKKSDDHAMSFQQASDKSPSTTGATSENKHSYERGSAAVSGKTMRDQIAKICIE
jgi:hypothetical protein